MENDFFKPTNPTQVWKIPYFFWNIPLAETYVAMNTGFTAFSKQKTIAWTVTGNTSEGDSSRRSAELTLNQMSFAVTQKSSPASLYVIADIFLAIYFSHESISRWWCSIMLSNAATFHLFTVISGPVVMKFIAS